MAFKPANASRPAGNNDFENFNLPTPRAGSRKARVALIVDMGIQAREPFENDDGTFKDQKPCQQVAVYADLVADVVDYGGTIGKQQYRLLLNKAFQGKVQGVNFVATPPKDAKGNTIPNKPWCFHPANLLSKLARATGEDDVIESMDIEKLLDKPFMAQVEVKETEDKNGKKDKDGNVIVYKNVNFKGAAQVPEDDDGSPIPIAELNATPRCVTFDNATKEDIKFIRGGLLRQIKEALNYEGSRMQAAIQAFEAENGGSKGGNEQEAEEEAPAPSKAPAKAPAKKKPAPAPVEDDVDSDVPF